MYTESGDTYIDFLSGAGALNYGHNNDYIKQQVLAYLSDDGVAHALDMHTTAKRAFLETFTQTILYPRQLEYKVQFCGPTGTNAVEAALKLARKITRRPGIFSFMGAYHGVSAGSLAVTGGLANRASAGVPLSHVTFMPFPHGDIGVDTSLAFIERALTDPLSGIEKPAAIILETIQAEVA